MDPFSITAGIFSVSNGTFTLATNFWKLKNVDDDLKICLHLLLMITKDINGARRLRSRKYPQHRSQTIVTDSLLDRANSAIQDLEIATNKMMKSIEAVRVEKSVDDSISIAKRFSWVFNGKDIFIAQQWVVTAAHTRLLAVIVSMESLPDMQVETLAPPPTYEEVILRSPRQLRALKGKSTAVVVFEREESTGMSCALSLSMNAFLVCNICLQIQSWNPPHKHTLITFRPAYCLRRHTQSMKSIQRRIW